MHMCWPRKEELHVLEEEQAQSEKNNVHKNHSHSNVIFTTEVIKSIQSSYYQ